MLFVLQTILSEKLCKGHLCGQNIKLGYLNKYKKNVSEIWSMYMCCWCSIFYHWKMHDEHIQMPQKIYPFFFIIYFCCIRKKFLITRCMYNVVVYMKLWCVYIYLVSETFESLLVYCFCTLNTLILLFLAVNFWRQRKRLCLMFRAW